MNYPIIEASLFLTFNIFDRYASIESINNNELSLIIIACLVLAIKYTETCVVNFNKLYICDQKFDKKLIIKWELYIMDKLN